MKYSKHIKGFTLIELLVVTAITGILAIASSQIILNILESQDRVTVINEVRQNGDQIINVFERDVRAAKAVSPSGGFTVVVTLDEMTPQEVKWNCFPTLTRNGVQIYNTDPLTGVRSRPIPQCVFHVTASAPRMVSFVFSLEQGANNPVEVEVPFRTSIGSRFSN